MAKSTLNYTDRINRKCVHWIEDNMKELNITQSDIGKMLGLSQQSVSHKMQGKSSFKLTELIELAHIFGREEDLESVFTL